MSMTPDTFLVDMRQLAELYPYGTRLSVAHDGFSGRVIGYYVTEEGKPGLVLQMTGTRVVHVYSTKWFQ
jgi:hypothetical protein